MQRSECLRNLSTAVADNIFHVNDGRVVGLWKFRFDDWAMGPQQRVGDWGLVSSGSSVGHLTFKVELSIAQPHVLRTLSTAGPLSVTMTTSTRVS